MRQVLLGAALVAALVGKAHAGPDTTTSWLMNDPASMMDLGILKTELLLRNGARGIAPGGSATFDFSRNRIRIYSYSYFPTEDPEKNCSEWFQRVRDLGGVDEKGEPQFSGRSAFSFMFEHAGFNRGDIPKDIFTELDKLFELECSHTFQGMNFKATAPLLGVGYSVEKLPPP